MSPQLRILVTSVSLLLLMITLELVRRGKLREEYSLLFLIWSGISLLLVVFAGTLDRVARALGIEYGPTLAFGIMIFLSLCIMIVQGVIISSLSTRNRDLTQKVAELEWQIRQIRRRICEIEEKPELVWPETIWKELAAIREQALIEA